MNINLIQKINKEIKDKDLKPTSRLVFQVKNLSLWIPGIFSIIVGAFAVSSLIFGIDHGGLRYSSYLDTSFIVTAIQALPYVWVVLATLFGLIAIRSLRITRHGYKYKAATLILGSLLASIVLGGVGYVAGIGQYIDKKLEQVSPRMSALGQQQVVWNNPNRGRLSGEVRKVRDDYFTVKDVSGDIWLVTLDEVSGKDTVIFNTLVDKNNKVRVIGYVDTEINQTFHACFVTPLVESRLGEIHRLSILPYVSDQMSETCQDALRK